MKKQQQYIAPRMECVNILSEGLLASSQGNGDSSAASISMNSQQEVTLPGQILNQGKSENPSIWE